MVFCITIMLLGVIGNIMVPIVILKTKDMRNSTNIFLTNLSIADLLVLLVCTPTVLVEVNTKPETWVLGHEMCKAVPFVELTVAHASVLTILAISFERYYAICEPLKAGYVCTKARAMLICLAAWMVAAIFTSPVLSIAKYGYEEYVDGTQVAICLTSVDSFWPSFFFVGSISLFFVLPFVILVVLYTVIAKNLMNNTAAGITSHHGNRSNVLKYRKQVILMLGAVVLSFFVCLLPFRALTLWIIIVPPETILALGIDGYYSLLYFCRIMLYLNSAMNPILYNLISSKFRDGFLRLLQCKSFSSRYTVSSSTGRDGTFRTTSTNASSSQSGERRRSEKQQQHHNNSQSSKKNQNNIENIDSLLENHIQNTKDINTRENVTTINNRNKKLMRQHSDLHYHSCDNKITMPIHRIPLSSAITPPPPPPPPPLPSQPLQKELIQSSLFPLTQATSSHSPRVVKSIITNRANRKQEFQNRTKSLSDIDFDINTNTLLALISDSKKVTMLPSEEDDLIQKSIFNKFLFNNHYDLRDIDDDDEDENDDANDSESDNNLKNIEQLMTYGSLV